MSMRRKIWMVFSALLLVYACDEPKPAPTGRLGGPTDLAIVKGCPQKVPGCDKTDPDNSRHLLLMTNSLDDALRVFDIEDRRFFSAPDPLFAFSIRVGHYPESLAVDPFGEYAFVVNGISANVSLVDLAPDRMVEVDTDWDSCTSFCGPCRDSQGNEAWIDEALDDRCRAGVSRVTLGTAGNLEPDDIVAPVAKQGDWEGPWDRTTKLPVFVSLAGSGQVARLDFRYPGYGPDYAQRMDLTEILEVGGRPSGMAMTRDGSQVFVADQASDSIIAIDTDWMTFDRIDIGGPSRRLALTPDDSTLYVVRLDDGLISLVDVATHSYRPAGQAPVNAQDPEGWPSDIRLPGIPRSIAFAKGITVKVFDETGLASRDYTTELLASYESTGILKDNPDYEETIVKTFAFVSDMNGYVYLLDAENNRAVDVYPHLGPNLGGKPSLNRGGVTIEQATLKGCSDQASHDSNDCPYPTLAGYNDDPFSVAKKNDGSDNYFPVPCDGNGDIALDADGVPVCICNAGYHAIGRNCISDDKNEILRNYYGIQVRPGITRTEGWILTWEGVITGTEHSVSGRLGDWRLDDDWEGLDFIASGVEAGDVLQILSDPPAGGGGTDDPCRAGSGASEEASVRKEFVIGAVDSTMLEISPVGGIDLSACWPEAVQYRVRAKNAWTVYGTMSGPMPRLTNVPFQESAPDPPAYDNGLIALTMFEPGTDQDGKQAVIPRDSTWGFNTDSGFATYNFIPSGISGGVAGEMMPVDLEDDEDPATNDSSGIDDRLYLLFEGSNAMLEFFPSNLDPTNFLIYQ
jgi:hypothetical protein